MAWPHPPGVAPEPPNDHHHHGGRDVTEAMTASPDVVDELPADHREATALLDQILTTSDPQTRRDMATP